MLALGDGKIEFFYLLNLLEMCDCNCPKWRIDELSPRGELTLRRGENNLGLFIRTTHRNPIKITVLKNRTKIRRANVDYQDVVVVICRNFGNAIFYDIRSDQSIAVEYSFKPFNRILEVQNELSVYYCNGTYIQPLVGTMKGSDQSFASQYYFNGEAGHIHILWQNNQIDRVTHPEMFANFIVVPPDHPKAYIEISYRLLREYEFIQRNILANWLQCTLYRPYPSQPSYGRREHAEIDARFKHAIEQNRIDQLMIAAENAYTDLEDPEFVKKSEELRAEYAKNMEIEQARPGRICLCHYANSSIADQIRVEAQLCGQTRSYWLYWYISGDYDIMEREPLNNTTITSSRRSTIKFVNNGLGNSYSAMMEHALAVQQFYISLRETEELVVHSEWLKDFIRNRIRDELRRIVRVNHPNRAALIELVRHIVRKF